MELPLRAVGDGIRRILPDTLDASLDVGEIREILELFGVQRDRSSGRTVLVRGAHLGILFQVLPTEERDTPRTGEGCLPWFEGCFRGRSPRRCRFLRRRPWSALSRLRQLRQALWFWRFINRPLRLRSRRLRRLLARRLGSWT